MPAIGPDGFVFSRIDFTFLIIAFPIVVLVQWLLERWVMRRVIWKLVRREKPDRGAAGTTQGGTQRERRDREHRGSMKTYHVGGVDRVEQSPDYIFIYTSPAMAHLIPKRAFRDPHEAERFYQYGQSRKAAAT